MTAATPPVSARWPGRVTGEPLIISCSLPKAIIEPEKLTEPMMAEKRIETMILAGSEPGRPSVSR